jgi:hypothetical protein
VGIHVLRSYLMGAVLPVGLVIGALHQRLRRRLPVVFAGAHHAGGSHRHHRLQREKNRANNCYQWIRLVQGMPC